MIDSKGGIEVDMGFWHYPLSKLLSLAQTREPTQVTFCFCYIKCCIFQPWRLACSGPESTITVGLELSCVDDDVEVAQEVDVEVAEEVEEGKDKNV